MNVTKLTKTLLLLSLGLGSVALALHRDNTDRRDELETLNERLKHLEAVQWNYEVNAALKNKLHRTEMRHNGAASPAPKHRHNRDMGVFDCPRVQCA